MVRETRTNVLMVVATLAGVGAVAALMVALPGSGRAAGGERGGGDPVGAGGGGGGAVEPLTLASAAGPATKGASGEKGMTEGVDWAPAVKPKELSDEVKKGLAWLVAHQHASGGWGQGEESRRMGSNGASGEKPNVADTCTASLALLRSGSTPTGGTYAANVRRGVGFVLTAVEAANDDDMFVTDQRGTRLQAKLGPFVDTFFSSMLLAEVVDRMPTARENARVKQALDKVLAKVEKNQRADGTWSDGGWAATLSQAVATKGLNRAAQRGVDVPAEVLNKAEAQARTSYDKASGTFSTRGSAGVDLYGSAAAYGGMSDSVNTRDGERKALQQKAAGGETAEIRAQATAQLKAADAARDDLDQATRAMVDKLDDERFIAGFGSNGGEEFLSYMTISEGLVLEGGEEWQRWDISMAHNLQRIQNADGSWSGHHCITGRTFCTAAALLVLMADRAPVPVAARMKRRG